MGSGGVVRGAESGSPGVSAFGAAGGAVAEGYFGLALGGQEFEVAACADAGDADQFGAFGGREVLGGVAEGGGDQIGGFLAEALGEAVDERAGGGEDPVDVGLRGDLV